MADVKDLIRPEYDYEINTIEGRRIGDNRRVFFASESNFKVDLYGKDGFGPGKVYQFYDYKHYRDAISQVADFDYVSYDEFKESCDKALLDSNLKVYGISIDEESNTVAVDVNGNINRYTLTPEQIEELPGFMANVSFSKEEFDDICNRLAYDSSRDLNDAMAGFDSVWNEKEDKVSLKINVNGEERSFDLSRAEAVEVSELFDHKGSHYWQNDEISVDKGYIFESEHCFTLEEFADKLDAFCKNGRDMTVFNDLNAAGLDFNAERKGDFVICVDDQMLVIDENHNIEKIDREAGSNYSKIIDVDENFTLNNFDLNTAVADVLMQIENKSVDLGVSLDGNPVQKDIQNCIKRLDNIKGFDVNEASASGFTFCEKMYLEGMQNKISNKDFKLSNFRSAEMAVINDMVVSNEFFVDEIKEVVANNSPFCVSKYGQGQADYLVNDCVNAVARDRYSREIAINKANNWDIDHSSHRRVCNPESYYLASCKDSLSFGKGYVEADKRAVDGMLNVYSVDEVKDVIKRCSPVFAGNPSGAVSFVDNVKAEKDRENLKLEKIREKIQTRDKAYSNTLGGSKDKPKDQSIKKNQNSGSGSGHGHSGNEGR